jgi:hypothetical protein
MTREMVLSLLLGLPAHGLDAEDAAARQARLSTVARAIELASQRATCSGEFESPDCQSIWSGETEDLSLLLVTQAWWESRLARHIHEGRCRVFECDAFRSMRTGRIEHRARTLWQLQRTSLVVDEWSKMVGADLESTYHAAWGATKVLARGYRACGTIAGSIGYYSGAGRCTWSKSPRRVATFEALRFAAATSGTEGGLAAGQRTTALQTPGTS